MTHTQDLGRPLAFGGNVDPTAADPSWSLRLTWVIEKAGLEFIRIQGHPQQSRLLGYLGVDGHVGPRRPGDGRPDAWGHVQQHISNSGD